jgi:hypothetical protein
LDQDDVNIISHLYFQPTILDVDTKQLIYCNVDTKEPLSGSGVIIIEQGVWRLAPGVVGFLKLAQASLASFPPQDWIFGAPLRDPLAKPSPPPACFLAMPYGPSWFEQVRDVVKKAAEATGYMFDIASDIATPGNIMQQVWNSVRAAQVVVADLTGLNANVMYELGVAHALGKPTILITQNAAELPFDVRGMRWHAYNLSAIDQLQSSLQGSLSTVQEECRLLVDRKKSPRH